MVSTRRALPAYDANKIESLLQDAGIVRNRLKVQAAVINAQKFLEVQDEFGSFDAFIWQFVEGKTEAEQLAQHGRDTGQHAGVGCDEQGIEAARLQVRRHDDLLRAHAGDRHGQRPHHGLFQAQGITII